MNRQFVPVMIGAVAGVAAALLCAGSVVQNLLSILLFALSALPILLAGLGWGPVSGGVAAIVCVLAVNSFGGDKAAAIIFFASALPAWLMAYFAGMARMEDGRAVEWYPLGKLLLILSGAVACGFIAAGIYADYPSLSAELAVELTRQLAASNAELGGDPFSAIATANFVMKALPFVQPATWTVIMAANFWVAHQLARRSGVFQRPADDWPASARMPGGALALFAAAMAATFFSGGLGMAAWALAGGLSGAFVIGGYAALHRVSRGAPWRYVVLWLAYALTFTAVLPVFIMLFAGLYDTAKKPAANGGASTL